MKLFKKIVLLLSLSITFNSYSQKNSPPEDAEFISIYSGLLMHEEFFSGFYLAAEYQSIIDDRYSYAISYKHGFPFGDYSAFGYNRHKNELEVFSFVGNYKVKLYKEIVVWDLGLGIDGMYYKNEYNNTESLYLSLSLNFVLNVKLSKNIYLQASGIPIILPSRLYYTPIFFENNNQYSTSGGYTFGNLGLKFKL